MSSTPSPSPSSIPAGALAIAAAHGEIDRAVGDFANATGIACPSGCGRCCLSPDIETSAAELLPLAAELMRRGEAWSMLDRLAAHGDERRCALYEPEPADPARGRCGCYAWRPSVCRLFGFAGRRDADGRPQFVACRVHREHAPPTVTAAEAAVAEGRTALPIMSDLAGRAAAVADGARARLEPINAALRHALEHVLLRERLAASEHEHERDGTPGTNRPARPPRRVA